MIFKQKEITLVEGFAGVGAIHMGLENAGIEVNRQGSTIIEWNVYSIIAYATVHYHEEYLQAQANVIKDLDDIQNTKIVTVVNPDGEVVEVKANNEYKRQMRKDYIEKKLSKYIKTDEDGKVSYTLSSNGKEPIKTLPTGDTLINLIAAVSVFNHEADISQYKYTGEKGTVDLFWQSSPCTDFSVMGEQKGGDENSGTSSSLLYEAVRLVDEMRPKVVIWENVIGVLSGKHKQNFDKYINRLSNWGYKSNYIKIDGYTLGEVQNRPRVFVYSYLDESDALSLEDIFNNVYQTKTLEDVIDFSISSHNPNGGNSAVTENFDGVCRHFKGKGIDYREHNFLFDAGLSKSRRKKTRGSLGVCPTLLTSKSVGKYSKDLNEFSILTSAEYWVLMGFDIDLYYNLVGEISDSQIYKICGNSVMVPQIDAIIKLGQDSSR